VDYQGSQVVWIVNNNAIARGLRCQRMPELAAVVEHFNWTIVNATGRMQEFIYVDETGQPLFTIDQDAEREITGTNIPDDPQAWTVSAILRQVLSQQPMPLRRPTWTSTLVAQTMKDIQSGRAARIDTMKGNWLEHLYLGEQGIQQDAPPAPSNMSERM
jgi:hypothetical protein